MPAHPFALIILILAAYRQNAACYKFDDIKRLKQKLLTSHDGDIQPRVDQNEQIKVKIIFYLTMLQDLNEREQKFTMLGYFNVSWWDEYLQWNVDDYNGIPSVHLRVDKVWQPGIALVNPAEDLQFLRGSSQYPYLRVASWGDVVWFPGERLSVRCEMDVRMYPFDLQHCVAQFSIWGRQSYQLVFTPVAEKVLFFGDIEHPLWDIKETKLDVNVSVFGESVLNMHFYFKRKPTFTVWTIIVPIILLSFINDLVFLIPNDSGERNSFSITAFLAYAVFISAIASILPEDSKRTSYITLYLVCLLAKSVMTVMMVVIQSRLALFIERMDQAEKEPNGKSGPSKMLRWIGSADKTYFLICVIITGLATLAYFMLVTTETILNL